MAQINLTDLVHMASHVHVGASIRMTCPQCGGGAKREISGQLYRKVEDQSVWFKCYRAGCPKPQFPVTDQPAEGRPPPPPDRSYRGRLEQLPGDVYEWLLRQFPAMTGATATANIKWNPDNESLIFPVRDPLRVPLGHVERFASDNWHGPVAQPKGTKVRTFFNDPNNTADLLSWYWKGGELQDQRAYLVEDCLSAMILADYCFANAVALLGTGINAGRVRQLQREGVDEIIFALDADATGQAFAHAKKWGAGFARCRVMVLDQDIKDMTQDEIEEIVI